MMPDKPSHGAIHGGGAAMLCCDRGAPGSCAQSSVHTKSGAGDSDRLWLCNWWCTSLSCLQVFAEMTRSPNKFQMVVRGPCYSMKRFVKVRTPHLTMQCMMHWS